MDSKEREEVFKAINDVSNVHWERSPRSGSATYFCIVNTGGGAHLDAASSAGGVAPCLCI